MFNCPKIFLGDLWLHQTITVKIQGSLLAPNRELYPIKTDIGPKIRAKTLENLEYLAHTVDERFLTTSLPRVQPFLYSNKLISSTKILILKLKKLIGEIKKKMQEKKIFCTSLMKKLVMTKNLETFTRKKILKILCPSPSLRTCAPDWAPCICPVLFPL